jgi:hypothetical protein
MEHTPGPWKYETRIQRGTYSQPVKGNPVRHYVTGHRPSQNFAEPLICNLGPTYDRAEANARLIAAAPDLLAALKLANEMLNYLYHTTDDDPPDNVDHGRVRVAIAKAEGK